jgi:hypothetical protein
MGDIVLTEPTVIVGQQVSGEAAKTRKALEQLITKINTSAFDIAELLYVVKTNGYYEGYPTFAEYTKTLSLKPRKSQYLCRIVEVMNAIGAVRKKYEPLGVAKLREITSLDVDGEWVNPETGDKTPLKDFIEGFIEKGKDLTLEEIKQHVRTLKGLIGDNNIIFLHLSVKQSVLDNTVRPALELAKMQYGSTGKDDEGISKDATDGQALEVVCVDFLNNNSGDGTVTQMPESEG